MSVKKNKMELFFEKYSPSQLYSGVGCGAEYISYEDEDVTHLDIPFVFPSEMIFKLKSFEDMCKRHHKDDEQRSGGYEEVWIAGRLKARGGFYQGIPCGCWRFFHDNGKLAETLILDDKGNIISMHSLSYPEGGRMFSFQYLGDGVTGHLKEYFRNGQQKSDVQVKDGKREGLCRTWHDNGYLSSEGVFKEGRRTNEYKQYNDEGILIFERAPLGHTRISCEKQYNDQGEVLKKCSYLGDNKHGEDIVYFDSARKVMLEVPKVTYYFNGREVARDEFLARDTIKV